MTSIEKFARHYGYPMPLNAATEYQILEKLFADARRHRLFRDLPDGYAGHFATYPEDYDQFVAEYGEGDAPSMTMTEYIASKPPVPSIANLAVQIDALIAAVNTMTAELRVLRGRM